MPLGPFTPQFGFNSLVPNGSTHNSLYVSAQTFLNAPTGAVAYLFQIDDTNSSNIRVATGAAASTFIGHQYEPGRTDYIPYSGVTLSVCPEGGTGVTLRISLTWYTST